jgi:hypothetical protein
MKRWIMMIALALLVAIGSYAVFAAQQQPAQPPMGRGMGQGGMMQGPMGQGGIMCSVCGMMAGTMMQKSMVQTENGIIVAVGNKLIKYDNDLNKVKEVTVDIDMGAMRQTVQQMMQACPMCQQMMRGQQQQARQTP